MMFQVTPLNENSVDVPDVRHNEHKKYNKNMRYATRALAKVQKENYMEINK